MFLGTIALTSCLKLRERAQCPDPQPGGQVTQNHLEGGETGLSQKVSPLLGLTPSLALHVALQSALLLFSISDLVLKVPQGWSSLP